MKKLIYSLLVLAFSMQLSIAEKIEVTKTIHEHYEVNRNTDFSINQKFGDIIIADWNKNEIDIELRISVKSKKKEKAEEYIKYITAEISKNGNSVSAKTIFDKKWNNHKKIDFEIKYIVKAPAYLKYDIINKFGNIAIANITGPTHIDLKYGNLLAKKLIFTDSKELNKLELAFSNADIRYCNYANIIMKYGKLKFGIGQAIKLNSEFTDVNIKKLESIHFIGKYGGLDIDTISIANIDGKFMDIDIEYLSSKLKTKIKYGNFTVNNITPFFSQIYVEGSFGDVKLLIHPDAVYQLNANVDYGDLNLPKKVNINRTIRTNGVEVNGIVGAKGHEIKSKVNIEMDYGDVSL